MHAFDDQLLRRVLRANATTSLLSGALLLATAPALAPALGVPAPVILYGLGVGLLLFAGAVLAVAVGRPISRSAALFVVGADVLWVLASVPVVAAGVLTPLGDVVVTGVAAMVAVIAALQSLGIRRARVALAA